MPCNITVNVAERVEGRPIVHVDEMARRHLSEVDRRISQLSALRGELRRMVEECGHGKICKCRVIEMLADSA